MSIYSKKKKKQKKKKNVETANLPSNMADLATVVKWMLCMQPHNYNPQYRIDMGHRRIH